MNTEPFTGLQLPEEFISQDADKIREQLPELPNWFIGFVLFRLGVDSTRFSNTESQEAIRTKLEILVQYLAKQEGALVEDSVDNPVTDWLKYA